MPDWNSLGLPGSWVSALFPAGTAGDPVPLAPVETQRPAVRTLREETAFLETVGAAYLPKDRQVFEASVNNLGALLMENGDYRQAAEFFKARLAGDPANVRLRKGLAAAWAALGGHHHALAEEQMFILREKLWRQP